MRGELLTSETDIDYAVLVDCAESFQRIGEQFIPRISLMFPEGSSEKAPSGLGDLVCCAANLGFSLELYLKALHHQAGNGKQHGHNLLELYTTLPEAVRRSIEREYDEYRKAVSPGVRASIAVAKGPRSSPPRTSYHLLLKDLESVLGRSWNIFSEWRYLFEVELPDKDSYQTHEIEYLLLHFACKAFSSHLKSRPP